MKTFGTNSIPVAALAAPAGEATPDLNEERWRLVGCAINEPSLSDRGKLTAIGAILNSRDQLSVKDIKHAKELAERFGWKRDK